MDLGVVKEKMHSVMRTQRRMGLMFTSWISEAIATDSLVDIYHFDHVTLQRVYYSGNVEQQKVICTSYQGKEICVILLK
jgi:hypothetical protein